MFSAKLSDVMDAAYRLGCFRQSRQKPVGGGKPVALWDYLQAEKQRLLAQQIINRVFTSTNVSKSFDLLENQQKVSAFLRSTVIEQRANIT